MLIITIACLVQLFMCNYSGLISVKNIFFDLDWFEFSENRRIYPHW
jgi:hypothetical protein